MAVQETPASNRLSEAQALGLLFAYTLIYVLPLHVYPPAKASPFRSRDDPSAIRARIRCVTVSTTSVSIVTFTLLSQHPVAASPWRLMGYWPVGLLETISALTLTILLFAAPLYERLLIDGTWREWVRLQPLSALWNQWVSWRNLVAGPITEECLFRSASVPLLLLAGHSMKSTVFLSPLVFGLAHVHHFYEFRITNPGTPIAAALVRSVLQFAYTYLFGIFATFVFLRTGSLLAIIVVHMFCNYMGLPRFVGSVEPYWMTEAELPDPFNRTVRQWTVLYYVLLGGGAVGFYQGLYPLSQSRMTLVEF